MKLKTKQVSLVLLELSPEEVSMLRELLNITEARHGSEGYTAEELNQFGWTLWQQLLRHPEPEDSI